MFACWRLCFFILSKFCFCIKPIWLVHVVIRARQLNENINWKKRLYFQNKLLHALKPHHPCMHQKTFYSPYLMLNEAYCWHFNCNTRSNQILFFSSYFTAFGNTRQLSIERENKIIKVSAFFPLIIANALRTSSFAQILSSSFYF